MKILYTIANETSECYGHGDFGKESRICRQGSYGSGDFPPLFNTKELAQIYLNGMEWKYGKRVVEMVHIELDDESLYPQSINPNGN